jgi:hypothetical protein
VAAFPSGPLPPIVRRRALDKPFCGTLSAALNPGQDFPAIELCGYAGDIKWRAHRFCRLQHKDLTIPTSYLHSTFTACSIEEFSKPLSGLGIGVRFHFLNLQKRDARLFGGLRESMIQGEQRNPTGFCRFQNIGIIGV